MEVDVWNNHATLDEREEVCARLGWPAQYAQGEASTEWFTEDQLAALESQELAIEEKEQS